LRFAFIGLLFLIYSRPAKIETYLWSKNRGPPLATQILSIGKAPIEPGQIFLMQLNLSIRNIGISSFKREQAAEAQEKYLAAEKANKDRPEMQTVLVSVDSIAALRKAYPNYYLDIGEFSGVLNKIVGLPLP
jgi:hypothetical protein